VIEGKRGEERGRNEEREGRKGAGEDVKIRGGE